jgi:hypothetical protein
MSKFEAAATNLEVCNVARHTPGYLNRQIITILMHKCLGVPDSVIRGLQVRITPPGYGVAASLAVWP